MSLFPLDALRNAGIDPDMEFLLEDVREDVVRFPFSALRDPGEPQEILDVYDLARPRLNVLLSLLEPGNDAIGADISTGIGFLPVLLSRLGVHSSATEADVRSSRFAVEHGIEVKEYRIGTDAPPLAPRSLDYVIFAEVIEHLNLSPVQVIREIAGLLRPGGRFLLTTPNVARLQHLELLVAGENFLEPFPDQIPPGHVATEYVEHVREYSVREIVEAVEGAGLAIDRVLMTGWGDEGYNPLPNPYTNSIIVVRASA